MKTKFEGAFKSRYDRYWDTNVVTTDKTIRQNFKFFKSNQSLINMLISGYCVHIKNILNNLNRQLPMFADPGVVLLYIEETQKQALEDLESYIKFLKAFNANNEVLKLEEFMSSLSVKDAKDIDNQIPKNDYLC